MSMSANNIDDMDRGGGGLDGGGAVRVKRANTVSDLSNASVRVPPGTRQVSFFSFLYLFLFVFVLFSQAVSAVVRNIIHVHRSTISSPPSRAPGWRKAVVFSKSRGVFIACCCLYGIRSGAPAGCACGVREGHIVENCKVLFSTDSPISVMHVCVCTSVLFSFALSVCVCVPVYLCAFL